MIKRRTITAAALLVLLACLGCGKSSGAADSDTSAFPDVTVAKVKREVLASSLVVNGNLTGPANHDAKLAALVPGRIARVLVSEGDAVHAGQVLAELENAPLRDQEHQAEAGLAQANANLENAKISAQRNEGLLQRGIASRKEVEDARTQLAVNEAAVRQAQAALSSAHTQAGRTSVRAPFAGTVVRRFLGVGDQVDGTGAQPIVEVATIDFLELQGMVPAARLNDISVGESFSFKTDAVQDMEFRAAVTVISPAVDPGSNNGTVRIRIANPKHLLKVGEYLSIDIPLKSSGAKLVVPRPAIYPDESSEPHVYRLQGDHVESVAVELGTQTKDKAEIISGVNDGDTVIVNGGYGLADKAKVHIHP